MTSSWTDIDLTKINPGFDVIPEGDYTYSVRGAKYSQWDSTRVEVSATIVSEGEFTGRVLFFSYPDPVKYDWVPKAFKRLEQALGVDMLPGQDPVDYLNQNAGLRFAGAAKFRKPGPNDAEDAPKRTEVNIFKVRAAA